MSEAPERIYLDGDVEAGDGMFPRCFENPKYASEPPVEYIRAEMLKGQTMSDNTDDMNDFVLLAIARDEAVSRVKELEARVAAADKLAEAVTHEREMVCQDFGMQQDAATAVHNALSAYQATKEGG